MDRVDYLRQALDINVIQADIVNTFIKDVPDDKLKDFLVFRTRFVQPMHSKELITKNALYEYRRKTTEALLRKGEIIFKNIPELRVYINTFYKNKNIANGVLDYLDAVIIGLDKDGNLINKYAQDDYGKFLCFDCDTEKQIYQWLFDNQNRIGNIDFVSDKNKIANA